MTADGHKGAETEDAKRVQVLDQVVRKDVRRQSDEEGMLCATHLASQGA